MTITLCCGFRLIQHRFSSVSRDLHRPVADAEQARVPGVQAARVRGGRAPAAALVLLQRRHGAAAARAPRHAGNVSARSQVFSNIHSPYHYLALSIGGILFATVVNGIFDKKQFVTNIYTLWKY